MLKIFLLIVFTLPSFLINAVENTSLRKAFLEAEKTIWKSDSIGFKKLYQQLHYYPLQPYLDQQNFIHNMNLSMAKEIDAFLVKYEGSPLDWPLRSKWLSYLQEKDQQSLFLYHYKPNRNATLNCAYFQYSLNEGMPDKIILPKITKIWTVGKSQPKICDPVFKQWEKAGYRTEEVIWKRISLAADGGKHTLIPYLTRLLPKSQQYLGTLWHRVRRNPAYVAKNNVFKQYDQREVQILSYGLKRLIWRQPEQAIKVYSTLKNKFKLTREDQQEITREFALSLANKNHSKAQKWLHQIDDDFVTTSVTQWRIAEVLRNNNWSLILRELESFPKEQQETKQWKYWYGRSLIETNKKDQGTTLLKALSSSRHYYGFLAASYLEVPFSLQDEPITVTQEDRNRLLKNSEAKRAFELFYVGKYSHARSEWNYWMKKLSDEDKLKASKIAHEDKWFDRAIFTLAKVGYLNEVSLRFPLAFEGEITKYSAKNKIDPAWAFAIARRESSFMSDANSGVGAKGLMQIMPATAKQLKRRSVSVKYLLNAKNNVTLGTKYLKMLSDSYKGNHVLATASYNAGPRRVKQWAKEAVDMPLDMWIETIPYKETRDYVKSVMAYQQIYQHQLGKEGTIFSDLINVTL